MKQIDCRGLACPGPVLQVKRALEELPPGGTFSVRLDSEASLENVKRFVESRGGTVKVVEEGGSSWLISIKVPQGTETRGRGDAGTRGPAFAKATAGKHGEIEKPPVVFVAGDTLGTGDDKLGRILMEGFINSLAEQERAPDKLLLMNGGVRLAAEGSPVLDAMSSLMDKGCEILVCGTCLDFFNLKGRLAVGTVSNMYDIQTAMLTASMVVRP